MPTNDPKATLASAQLSGVIRTRAASLAVRFPALPLPKSLTLCRGTTCLHCVRARRITNAAAAGSRQRHLYKFFQAQAVTIRQGGDDLALWGECRRLGAPIILKAYKCQRDLDRLFDSRFESGVREQCV